MSATHSWLIPVAVNWRLAKSGNAHWDLSRPVVTHQPLNPFEVDDCTHVSKLSADAVPAVGVVTPLVNLANALGHDLVAGGALAGIAMTPVVVSAGEDVEVFAHCSVGKTAWFAWKSARKCLVYDAVLVGKLWSQAFVRMSRS